MHDHDQEEPVFEKPRQHLPLVSTPPARDQQRYTWGCTRGVIGHGKRENAHLGGAVPHLARDGDVWYFGGGTVTLVLSVLRQN